MGNKTVAKFKEKTWKLKYNLSALYLAYKRKDVPIYAKAIIIIKDIVFNDRHQ